LFALLTLKVSDSVKTQLSTLHISPPNPWF